MMTSNRSKSLAVRGRPAGVSVNGSTFASQLPADPEGGDNRCGGGWHVCNAREYAVYGILDPNISYGGYWISAGFLNYEPHLRSLVNGQQSTVCPPGMHLISYGKHRNARGRLHCSGDGSVRDVLCCKNM